ncbi:MAG TPA: S-methyl-5'-thioadenosine phosphorylase [Mycobacteriales bacterium]|nr:S-methyl-5'-thioadenosine phosphorylase [Mycobacteriales bacterium]
MTGGTPRAEIGVIGGSGLYSFLADAVEVPVSTPYGPPSDPLVIGDVGGRQVAFLPRHGRDHRFPPHRINYRANLWALRSVGVRQVLGPCAVGSLHAALGPGTFVLPDQLVDRTTSRVQTYFDAGATHIALADPYCPDGRSTVAATAAGAGLPIVDGGVMVVIEGPRFSTRAESRWYAAQGWSLVNMTGHPEAVLARELALCYTAVALVTDVDAGVDAESAVDQEEVFRVFGENVAKLRDLLFAVIPALPAERSCLCTHAHDGLTLPITLPE